MPEVLWEDSGDPPLNPPLFVMSHVDGDCVEPLFDGCAPSAELAERYRNACRAMAALHSLSPGDLGLGSEPVIDAVSEVERWCQTLQTVDASLVPGWPGYATRYCVAPQKLSRPAWYTVTFGWAI